MKRGIGSLLLGATAFAGGLVSGFLFTPKSGRVNRRWISKQSKETKHWLEDQGKKIVADSEKNIERVSKGIQKTIKDSVPNLYEATEDLHFSEGEEIEEITTNG